MIPPVATAAHEIDATPTALGGLADGTRYLLQHASGADVLLASAAAAPPASSVAALVLRQGGQPLLVTPESGVSLWAWTTGGKARLVTTEA